MAVGDGRDAVVARLERAGCINASEEADQLRAATTTAEQLEAALTRRAAGEPLAWITGRTSFCGMTLHVDPGVYVPRRQTESLAEKAGARLPATGRAADLCTGSGAVAAHLRAVAPDARIVAVDSDPLAVRCARSNRVTAIVGDLGAPLASDSFDLVTAVAPYVPTGALAFLPRDVTDHEPRAALDGGADGLHVVRRAIADAARLLRVGGSIVLEIGGDQLDPTTAALADAGFAEIEPWSDGEGDLRGIAAVHTR
jgi:release factor glutamine methyltransferase